MASLMMWLVCDRIMTSNDVHRRNQALIRLGVGRLGVEYGINELGVLNGISDPKKMIWGTEDAVAQTISVT